MVLLLLVELSQEDAEKELKQLRLYPILYTYELRCFCGLTASNARPSLAAALARALPSARLN